MLRTRSPARSLAHWTLLGMLMALPLVAVAAPEPARPWRVCVSDASLPPYLNNDPKQLGIFERLAVDAGRQVGLSVELLRYPIKRCAILLAADGIEAAIATALPSNMAIASFPMKDGAVDISRRLGRLNMVWVKRPDSPFKWEGSAPARSAQQAPLIVGTRTSMRSVAEPLRSLGFEVDDHALNARQLLMKLAAGRVDLAVALREEVEFALSDPALSSLVVLPRAFQSNDYYAAVKPQPAAELREKIEAWWNAIGKLRDLPEYRNR